MYGLNCPECADSSALSYDLNEPFQCIVFKWLSQRLTEQNTTFSLCFSPHCQWCKCSNTFLMLCKGGKTKKNRLFLISNYLYFKSSIFFLLFLHFRMLVADAICFILFFFHCFCFFLNVFLFNMKLHDLYDASLEYPNSQSLIAVGENV